MNYVEIGGYKFEYGGEVTGLEHLLSTGTGGKVYKFINEDPKLNKLGIKTLDRLIVFHGNISSTIFQEAKDDLKNVNETHGIYTIDDDGWDYILDNDFVLTEVDLIRSAPRGDELKELITQKYSKPIGDLLIDKKKLQSIREYKPDGGDVDGEILYYEINEEDEDLVILIKKEMNARRFSSLSEFYESWTLEGVDAWNYVYGLRTRKSMTWEVFNNWVKALGMTVHLELRDGVDDDTKEALEYLEEE